MFYDWRRVGEREWERSIKGSSGSPKMALEYFSFERAPPLNTLTNSSFNVWFKNARERERGFFPRDIIFSNIIYFWDQRLIPGIIKVNFIKGSLTWTIKWPKRKMLRKVFVGFTDRRFVVSVQQSCLAFTWREFYLAFRCFVHRGSSYQWSYERHNESDHLGRRERWKQHNIRNNNNNNNYSNKDVNNNNNKKDVNRNNNNSNVWFCRCISVNKKIQKLLIICFLQLRPRLRVPREREREKEID